MPSDYPQSTAEKAGLKPGDLIVSVDDEKLTADAPEHEEDLAILMRQYDPGANVKRSSLVLRLGSCGCQI